MEQLRYQNDYLKAMNQKLKDNEDMYRLVCETSNNAFLYYSFETKEAKTLGRWKDFFDFDIKEVADAQKLYESVSKDHVDAVRDILFLENQGLAEMTCECKLNGKKTWLFMRGVVEYNEAGEPLQKIISISDITKFRKQSDELTYLAYYDTLTGLYSRNYFVRLLGEFVRNARENGEIVSVMVIDIDDFRKVNDGMGMVAGDELVQQFGEILKQFMSKKVIVSHINSDIYCVAIYQPCGENKADVIYERIMEQIHKPFVLSNGMEVNITICVGVAEFPEAANAALELINCAEIVMFRGKELGKNSIQYFDTPILNDFLRNVQLDTKLRDAVSNSCFSLQYQPQFFTGNKKLRGVEALIRWQDIEEHKMISPGVFIPAAEKNGTIIPIGNWVLEESIRQYAEWRKRFRYPLIMSINVSAIQYMKEDFVEHLIAIIEKYHVEPKYIELEVTESVLIEGFDSVVDKLMELRDYGIRVSLDDFGTGFSSLSYLKKLPIDTLKIDKSFIDTVLTDAPTRVITESIIQMVKTLGLETVAEGVEEEQQYEYLHAIGCDIIQGYYLGRPQSVEAIERLLE
ncbi:MAG: GGDEF domain-containing protein [Lachnospiraceae bacterium]|nr:GGDEF domain-containing protein [Lachnospiraceae bacterium]